MKISYYKGSLCTYVLLPNDLWDTMLSEKVRYTTMCVVCCLFVKCMCGCVCVCRYRIILEECLGTWKQWLSSGCWGLTHGRCSIKTCHRRLHSGSGLVASYQAWNKSLCIRVFLVPKVDTRAQAKIPWLYGVNVHLWQTSLQPDAARWVPARHRKSSLGGWALTSKCQEEKLTSHLASHRNTLKCFLDTIYREVIFSSVKNKCKSGPDKNPSKNTDSFLKITEESQNLKCLFFFVNF